MSKAEMIQQAWHKGCAEFIKQNPDSPLKELLSNQICSWCGATQRNYKCFLCKNSVTK